MTTVQEERRLAALTAMLVQHGVLPAFYRTPKKQVVQVRALQGVLGGLLGGFGVTLAGLLESGAVSAANEVAVNGALALDAEAASTGLQTAYRDAYTQSARDAFRRQARRILYRSGIEVSWELAESRAREVLGKLSFRASDRLMRRVTGDVKGVLLQGVDGGLGTREIGRNLRTVIDGISSKQAEGIARTEVNSASNRGNFLAMEEADVEFVQWVAAQDTRTRSDHLAHHGLVVKRGERFPSGLRYPGDRDGPVGSWVSCRCVGVSYFPLRSELTQQTPYVGRA